MNKLKIIFFLIITYFLYLNNITNAAINFTVSPPLYKIDAFTGTTITKTALLRNNGEKTVYIGTTKTDFQANGNTGKPLLVRYSELVHPNQQLSEWINIDTSGFTINPNEDKTVNFTLNIPNNASPGGHYGAVCFKNNKSEASSGNSVNINVDYCILLIVNVDGEIVTKAEIKDTNVTMLSEGLGKGQGYSSLEKDKCPIMDLTASSYDGKCIDIFFEKENLKESIDKLNLDGNSDISKDDFKIDFNTPIKNEGNTHLNPIGNITLKDENGKTIKSVGKITLKDENGVLTGEKIVDYLPINDEGGLVLPGQTRDFLAHWKGFPYESYDESGKIIIKYWTPEEYYSNKNRLEGGYILPWQRENERLNKEKITADINLSYKDKDGEDVEFNSAKEFDIYYKERYIGTNPYAVICAMILILVIYLLWLIFRKKKIKCISCKKKIEKDMLICPYCGVKQDDKRYIKNKKVKKKKTDEA